MTQRKFPITNCQSPVNYKFRILKLIGNWNLETGDFKRGFTLIEVLVVIGIIGILISLVVVSYGRAQKQARDTQRKSEVKQYQAALENYSSSNASLYPSYTSSSVISSSNLCGATVLSTYLSGGCPVAPRSADDASYSYRFISDGTGGGTASALNWVVSAKLEGNGNFWVVCSNGKAGEASAQPATSTCPI